MHRSMNQSEHEDLSAYLDGELTDAEVAELEAELARDPALRAELDELENMVLWMRRDGPEAAPFGFHRRVMDRVEQEHPASGTSAWWRRPFGIPLEGWLVAAAAAAVLFLALPKSGPEGAPWPSDERPAALRTTNEAATEPEAADPTEQALPQAVEPLREPSKRLPSTPSKMSSYSESELPPIGVPLEPASPEHGVDGEGPVKEPPTKIAYPPGFKFLLEGPDPAMKRRVLAVASRYGTPMGVAGQEASGAFTGASETILVEVPSGKLAQLHNELARLGYTMQGHADNELVRGTSMLVRIELQLERDGAAGD